MKCAATNKAENHEQALQRAYEDLEALRQRMVRLRRKMPARPLKNYSFRTVEGPVTLSELFEDKQDLIVIHSMGASCPYCTLWADGFNGVNEHLRDRAAFVVISDDPLKKQGTFARKRGWRFKMASSRGTSFKKDLGFWSEEWKGPSPGVSTFAKGKDGQVRLVTSAPFGPGDLYCGVWHLFDLLEKGADGWEPRFRY